MIATTATAVLVAVIALNVATPAQALPFELFPGETAPTDFNGTLPSGDHIIEFRDIEARTFATELAGGLAGTVANLGTSDTLKEIIAKIEGKPAAVKREIIARTFATELAGGLAGTVANLATGDSLKEIIAKVEGKPVNLKRLQLLPGETPIPDFNDTLFNGDQIIELRDIEARTFATELAGGLAGTVANLATGDTLKEIIAKVEGKPVNLKRTFGTELAGGLAGTVANLGTSDSLKAIIAKIEGKSKRDVTDLETRQFATELAGGLASTVANLGTSDTLKEIISKIKSARHVIDELD